MTKRDDDGNRGLADMERRLMLRRSETPEEAHLLDFLEMVLGDDGAADGDVPVAERRVMKQTGMEAQRYLSARARLRKYAERLPDDLKREALAAIQARKMRRS